MSLVAGFKKALRTTKEPIPVPPQLTRGAGRADPDCEGVACLRWRWARREFTCSVASARH
jgi:hypothetical protein